MKKIFKFLCKSPKKALNFKRIENSCKHQEWILNEEKKAFQCKNCEITKELSIFN